MSELREKIARALFESDWSGRNWMWTDDGEKADFWERHRNAYIRQADAVLAVLADLPYEVWGAAVEAIDVDDMDQRARESIVNTVFRAAFGGSDE